MSSRDVTQARIAKEIGFDRTTVSAILNNRSGMSFRPETRRIVLDAANRLGYRPHRHAQVMRRGKTGMIGLIQFGGVLQANELRALHTARAIHTSGYRVLSSHVHWATEGADEGINDSVNNLLEARVEGVVLVGATEHLPEDAVKQLRDAGVPVVSLSGTQFDGVPQVRSDFRQGMFELTSHLLRLGHRRLIYAGTWGQGPKADLSRPESNRRWPFLERVAGFQEAIQKSKLDSVEYEVFSSDMEQDPLTPYEAGKTMVQKILQRTQRPDVVLCANDSWAIGALSACAEAGLRVPQDIAITGSDNDTIGQFTLPPLTTIAQPTEAIATKAVDLLLKQVRGEKLSESEQLVRLPCELVVRQSCGATMALK